jgi:hypothetical protein
MMVEHDVQLAERERRIVEAGDIVHGRGSVA